MKNDSAESPPSYVDGKTGNSAMDSKRVIMQNSIEHITGLLR